MPVAGGLMRCSVKPMSDTHHTLRSESPDATQSVARTLAPAFRPGDTLLLSGPIGAGKSHFARSFIQTLLIQPEDVPSPTYTLVQTYQTLHGELWHADLYRLGDIAEVHELGLWSAFEDAICLVEWPDRLGPDAPTNGLHLTLDPLTGDNDRALHFSWSDARWTDPLLKVLSDQS